MEIKVPGTALPPPLGPFPSLESSSLRKESSSCPSKAPTMPIVGMHFYQIIRGLLLKDLSNVWERIEDRMEMLPSKEGLREGVSTRF